MSDRIYPIAKKILFKLGAEAAHKLTLTGMRNAHRLRLLSRMFPIEKELHKPVKVMGLTFPNAVGLAAGMDKSGGTVDAFGAIGFGHIEAGTVTPKPQAGNPKPRLFRLVEEDALINRMGFNNPGLEDFVRNLKKRRTFSGIVGASIGKNAATPNEDAIDDYVKAFRGVFDVSDYIAVNISSPNTKGLRDLQSIESSESLVLRLLEERQQLLAETEVESRPFAVKFSPDLTEDHLCGLAEMCNRIGVDAVIATNTTLARTGVESNPLHHEKGGLSGLPLAGRALDQLKLWRRELDSKIPVISVGGIMSGDDAKERIDAGAALVQVYTGLVYRGPALVREILEANTKRQT
ncbi:MAG: dihydroorotate dehydrogenase [Verrucomicrobiales bacterium]|jgi:dihydroorotate dehydrogenase